MKRRGLPLYFTGAGVTSLFLVFYHLSGAVRDNADGGALQPHEVSHLSEPILVNVNGPVNSLVGKESRAGCLSYLNSLLDSQPVGRWGQAFIFGSLTVKAWCLMEFVDLRGANIVLTWICFGARMPPK